MNNMKPKSDNLFHFTNSLDILKLIIEKGIQPRFCLEDIEWLGFQGMNHIAYPMSCFCDIPLSRISDHTDFYGNYGLGLTKEWRQKNNLNPVVYCTPDGHIQSLAKYLLNMDFDKSDVGLKEEDMHIFHFISLIKPTYGKMVTSGGTIEKEFYQENEWRYVPSVDKFIPEARYEDQKEVANKEMEAHALEFTPQDIRYIFVKSDTDIPSLVDFINETLGHFPLKDLKILQSRIVSLETLSVDL